MALGALAEHHCNYPVHRGTCKGEKADHHADLLKLLSDACSETTAIIGRPVYCIVSDGESHQGKALRCLTEQRSLSSSSTLYPMLGSLPLLN